ncbi:MAG: hypothetical protein KAH38_01525 [Candidatus Hydrogenedentes bacterium]|nr:hypothetical protein [Candidatus Hydrogenedentota bacterium]
MNHFVRNPHYYETHRRKQRDKIAKFAEKKIREACDDNPAGKILGSIARFILQQDPRRY